MSKGELKGYIAVTDEDWFEFLRKQKDLDEVNFWQPGGKKKFKAIQRGQPFLFKLRYPQHFIVGGGFYSDSTFLPCSWAWDAFGIKNGAGSLSEMKSQIEKYKDKTTVLKEDYTIGCVILLSPFFFDRDKWIQFPSEFNMIHGSGITFNLTTSPGKELWESVQERMNKYSIQKASLAEPEAPIYGDSILARQRLGQGAFRVRIANLYNRRCSVTGEKAFPALDAAHLRPVSEGGRHHESNGILLRSDIHRLFDRGYVTITPQYEFLVSQKIKRDYHNGEPYYPLHGKRLWIPSRPDDQPDKSILEWHNDTKFLR